MKHKILIKNGHVVTMDAALGVLPNADVLVIDDKIVEIGHNLTVPDAEIIDATSSIVMPGLIDGHRHIWQGAMRAVCADWTLMDYVNGIRLNAANVYTPEDMYAAQYQGALEAIDSGVTTVADYCHNLLTPEHAHESIRGIKESGLRTRWCYGFNRPFTGESASQTNKERVDLAKDLAREHFTSDSGLVTMGVSPEEFGMWPNNQHGAEQFQLADELNARVFWHANGNATPHGREGNIHTLDALGLLNANMTFVHMHATDYKEFQLIADAGAGLAFTPDSELQMGMGYPQTALASEFGIPQVYGIDITSNNSADFFSCLRMGLQTARCVSAQKDFGELPMMRMPFSAMDALSWGTIEGAKAIGLDHMIGSLTPGKKADIILINTDCLTLAGWNQADPVGTVISQAQARNVDTVLVDGQIVKRDGKLIADTQSACQRLSEASERVRSKVEGNGGFLAQDYVRQMMMS